MMCYRYGALLTIRPHTSILLMIEKGEGVSVTFLVLHYSLQLFKLHTSLQKNTTVHNHNSFKRLLYLCCPYYNLYIWVFETNEFRKKCVDAYVNLKKKICDMPATGYLELVLV